MPELLTRQIIEPKVLIYPFITQVIGTREYTMGYSYLDVLTDGAFNPLNEDFYSGQVNPACVIRFDDHDKLRLKNEFCNIPIYHKTFFDVYNSIPKLSVSPTILNTGFGNMYFVLKKSIYENFEIRKIKPTLIRTATTAVVENIYLGGGLAQLPYVLGIPYIPALRYSYLSYNFWASDVCNVKITAFAGATLFNGNEVLNADNPSAGTVKVNSNRIVITLTPAANLTYYLNVFLTENL